MIHKKRTFSLLVPFICLLVLKSFSVYGQETCDACGFTKSDSADCKVYGQLGDDVLIGWSKASQECLNVHNIKVQSIDPDLLLTIFPNPDGSGANVNSFVNYLRFNEGAAVNGIRLSLEQFFEEGTTSGIAVLKDNIVVNGVTYDCKSSASDCWNKGIKTYFGEEPGTSEMQAIGADLHNRQKLDRELEQSTVRIAICTESDGDICEPLKTEIEGKKGQASGCSSFGLGPAQNAIPGCENVGGTSGTPAGNNTGSGALMLRPSTLAALVLVSVGLPMI